MIIPTSEKYIIFLHPRYFSKSIFQNIYQKIKNNLENKGIVVFNIKPAVNEIKKYYLNEENNTSNKDNISIKDNISNKENKEILDDDKNNCDINLDNSNQVDENTKNKKSIIKNKLSFDDNPFPNTNILYVHLFNGQYYNDSIYIKKKIEYEREMLILLAGKLGVKTINYETEMTEITISKAEASLNIKSLKNGFQYNKNIETKKGIKGREVYLNRGAPSYFSPNIGKMEEHIKNTLGKMKSNVFNYDFYKNNPKLESFVYKRYEFKMLKLEYTIDTEDISDISFIVKSCFVDYGINISFEKTVTYKENIKYTLEFFTDLELKKAYFNANQAVKDNFYFVREQYDCSNDKDLAVQSITEYATKLAKKCYYKNKKGYGVINNFSNRLSEFIKRNTDGTFESICHHFRSSLQIKNWIYKNLSDDSIEIVDEENQNPNLNSSNQTNQQNQTNIGPNNIIKRGNTLTNNVDEIHGFALSPRSKSNDNNEIHGYTVSPRSNNTCSNSNNTVSNSNNTGFNIRAYITSKLSRPETIQSSSTAVDSNFVASSSNTNNVYSRPPPSIPSSNDGSPSHSPQPVQKRSRLKELKEQIQDQDQEKLKKESMIQQLKSINTNISNTQKIIDTKKMEIINIDYELEYLNEQLKNNNETIARIQIENSNKQTQNIIKITKIKQKRRPSINLSDIQLDIKDNLGIEQFKNKELLLVIQKKEHQKEILENELRELMISCDENISSQSSIINKLVSMGMLIEDITQMSNIYLEESCV